MRRLFLFLFFFLLLAGGAEADTGGSVVNEGGYTFHTFTANSTYVVTANKDIEILVIGGGGGGGGTLAGNGGAAGGGAGGLRFINLSVTTGNYSIVVGLGGIAGAGGTSSNGGNGQFSSFGLLYNASGGGGGAKASGGGFDGVAGGSGGGAYYTSTPGAGNLGGYTPAEGYNGSQGCNSGVPYWGGGGGGSSQKPPNAACAAQPGVGGNGSYTNFNGSFVTYAGGGGGGNNGANGHVAAPGGTGGGGNGATYAVSAQSGTANTGGGGGGGAGNGDGDTTRYAGGAGGSGIVIIRYGTTSTPYAHIKLLDSYDNSTISGVTVFLGTTNNVTDGSGIAYFHNQTTGLNYSVSDASYFGATGTAVENATTNVNLYQGFTNISSFVNLAGEAISVSGFNLTVTGARTYTSANVSGPFYLTDGSNSLTASIVNYLGGSGTATISAPENTSASITGLYNHTLTLQANSAENGSMINSFNVTVYADWNNLTGTTTNGTLTFNLLSGRSYTIAYEADGYLSTNVSHSPTNATQYFNTSLYRKQAYFNFTFRNETNRVILNDTFITFNTVDANNLYTPFNTSNGTANLVVGFVPGLYTIRYAADGYSNRDYYIYLEYNNTYVLDLFLIPNDVYGPGVVEVRDPDGSPRENAIIEMKRYYGLNGTTFEIVSMATSNNVGEAVMLAEPVNAFYTWRVLVDNVVRYETFTPELLALESDGLWHQIFILNGTGTGYNDQTGIAYNWTYRNNTLYNGSIYPLGISFSSSVASISDCSLSILKAGDRSVLNTTSGFCTSGGGSTFLLHTAVTDENVILVATYTVNGEEYEVQNYYAVRTLPASEFTLKTALDRFSAFDGGGFNDSTRFLLAVILTILLTLGVATKTDLMNSPEEIMLFVFVTTLFFSYAGWLYIPIETIPFPELRQYLLSVIVGIIATVMFFRKSGVSSQ